MKKLKIILSDIAFYVMNHVYPSFYFAAIALFSLCFGFEILFIIFLTISAIFALFENDDLTSINDFIEFFKSKLKW